MNPVEQAIAQAQAQANQLATQAQAQVPQTAVATPVNAGAFAAPSMASLMASGFAVDQFLKITDAGILMKKDATAKEAQDKIRVVIDMKEGFGFKPLWTASYGTPVQYIESFDGVNTTKGESFATAIATARAVDHKVNPYQTVKIGMKLLANAGGVTAGTSLGLSLTRTGLTPWQQFYQAVAQAGLLGQEVEVEVSYKVGKKQGFRDWGVPVFTLIGEHFEHGGE